LGAAGGLALGVGGAAGLAGARQGVRSAEGLANRALARSDAVQQQLAQERIRSAASDPEAAARSLDAGAGAELVPGSKPTTFQATGDMGLGSLERELQTANPAAFTDRRAAQNSARLDTLRGVQGEGEAGDVLTFLRGQLDDIDALTLRDETGARSAAEAAAERIRPRDDADGLGRSVRGSMVDAEAAARKRESGLWNAVDPDGSLTIPTQGVRQAANEVYGKLTQSARLGVSPAEKQLANRVLSFGPIESFKDMQDLASLVKATMRSELRQSGRTPAYARLAQLSGGLRDAMMQGAATRIGSDPATAGRFRAIIDEWKSGTDPRSPTSAESPAGRRVLEGYFGGGIGSGTLFFTAGICRR
jgi:hypothetical protein